MAVAPSRWRPSNWPRTLGPSGPSNPTSTVKITPSATIDSTTVNPLSVVLGTTTLVRAPGSDPVPAQGVHRQNQEFPKGRHGQFEGRGAFASDLQRPDAEPRISRS